MKTAASPRNDNVPAEVFPLAQYLCEEMEARGWIDEDVAIRMSTGRGIARDLLCLDLILCVHRDTLLIDDDTIEALARIFGVSPELFRNLDAVWRKHPDRRSPFTPPESLFGPAARRALIQPVSA